MNIKNNFACFVLTIVGLIGSLTLNLAAQNRVAADSKQEQKPIVADRFLQNYIDISSLPVNKRPATFSKLAAEDKANLFKLHLALQLVKHSNLSKEQKDLILNSISTITPDTYNQDNADAREKAQQDASLIETKAKASFSKQEAFEIFASLGGTKEDVAILQMYLSIGTNNSLCARKEVFNNSSAQNKSDLWKVHLALYLARHSELSKEKQDFILRGVDFVKPAIYEDAKDEAEQQLLDKSSQELTRQAIELFTKDVAFEIFAKLGAEVVSDTQSLQPDCSCSKNSDWCAGDSVCASPSGCASTPRGCGTFWQYSCNGMCYAS